jgi:hypothetical protein
MPPTTRPRRPAAAAPLALAAALTAAPAGAQLLGLPVAQSPFGGRPFAVAANAGGGGDGLRTYGLALGLRKGDSRLTGAAGIGSVQGFRLTRPSFGARVAYLKRLGTSGTLAAAPFAGFGYVARGDIQKQTASRNGGQIIRGNLSVIPAGVSLGYRRTLAGRPVAVHVSPQAQYWRRGGDDMAGIAPSNRFYPRAALGVDAGVTSQLGLTLAVEGGASREAGTGPTATGLADGPRPVLFGAALSYSPGRRRRP